MTEIDLYKQIVQKYQELVVLLNNGYETEMIEQWEKANLIKYEDELASLRQQLEKVHEIDPEITRIFKKLNELDIDKLNQL